MDIKKVKIGTKLELELINSLGEKIGQTYISQLTDVFDMQNISIGAPIHESRLMLITSGTKVRITLLHETLGLFCFTGIISGRERKEAIIIFNVKITGDFEKIQRRKYYRHDCNLNATYRILEDINEKSESNTPESTNNFKKTLTKNISGSGVSIITDEDSPKGSNIELTIQLTSTSSIKATCKVVRNTKILNARDKYDLGLYFVKISQRDQDMVVKYIFDLQRLQLKNNLTDKI
jgi:c-di-GMP-binding flagellar brake protein YcgR